MPNVSFDIFFDKDFINITATRGHTAPKAKPEWKVRTAPKLPPKPVPEDHSGTPRPPPREKLTSTRQPLTPAKQNKAEEKPDNSDAVSQTSEARPMATQWVLGKVSEALAPTVSSTVASAGSFAGGAVNAVGNTINGVGEGINNSIRRYGDGVKDYGNAVMDWTQAGAVRAPTASNPLGLSANKVGGKIAVTNPRVYTPPQKSTASKTLMTTSKTAGTPQKKIEGGTPKKALPAPGPKPGAAKKVTSAAPAKKVSAAPLPKSTPAKTPTTPNPGAMRKKPAETGSKTNGATGAAKKVTPVKASTAGVPKTTTTGRPKTQGNPTAAANPLGLAF